MSDSALPGNRRILVVDDNPAIHEDFRKVLCAQSSGGTGDVIAAFLEEVQTPAKAFEVDFAWQGQEALEMVQGALNQGQPYAVAFVDIRMPPGWDGVETVSRLWQVCPQLQVVICTAFSDHSWNDVYAKLGRSDRLLILKKPFDNIEVIQLAHALTQKWDVTRRADERLIELDELVERRTRELRESNLELQRQIAEKIAAEQLLIRQQSFTRQVIDTMPGLLFVHDAEGKLVLVNNAMAQFHNSTSELMLGKNISEFSVKCKRQTDSEPVVYGQASQLKIQTVETSCECEGGVRRFLVLTTPLALPDGASLVLNIMSDITELKRAEESRAVLNKLESTGVLAGGIAHDFNNLLTVILLNIEMAMNSGDEDPTLHLDAALRSTRAAHNLTKQLITFAHGDALIRRNLDCAELIRDSISMALSGCSLALEFHLPPDLHWVEVDEAQISQVLLNLAFNARDAMPEGGCVSVRAQNVNITDGDGAVLPPGRYVRVSVTDTGTGIAPDILPKIFDPYFSTKSRGCQQGMGLGLTICHSIIQKHGGCITVESKVGVGSTFHVFLPASVHSGVIESAKRTAPRQEKWKILIMDDDVGIRVALSAVLGGRGHEVIDACDGDEAVAHYKAARASGKAFDLVMLDLTVRGGKGGVETLQDLLKIDPGVKAIVMSGYAEDPVLMEPARFGFKGGLEKTFDTDQLVTIMRGAVTGETHRP